MKKCNCNSLHECGKQKDLTLGSKWKCRLEKESKMSIEWPDDPDGEFKHEWPDK